MRLLRWTGLIILLTLLTEQAYGQTFGVISKAEAARTRDVVKNLRSDFAEAWLLYQK
jgi:hypothetical protein